MCSVRKTKPKLEKYLVQDASKILLEAGSFAEAETLLEDYDTEPSDDYLLLLMTYRPTSKFGELKTRKDNSP